jgi:hypothetical protein
MELIENIIRLKQLMLLESKENLNTKNIVSTLSNLSSVKDINNYFKTFDTPEKEKLGLIFPAYGQYTVV